MSNNPNTQPPLSTQVEDPSKPDAPQHEHGLFEAARDKFQAHLAGPGPVRISNMQVPEEGTKEERRAKAEALNKDK